MEKDNKWLLANRIHLYNTAKHSKDKSTDKLVDSKAIILTFFSGIPSFKTTEDPEFGQFEAVR